MNLRARLHRHGGLDKVRLADRTASHAVAELVEAPADREMAQRLAGRSILIATEGQMAAAKAMLVLDGLARRMLLLPPGIAPEQLPAIVRDAEIDLLVTDRDGPLPETLPDLPCIAAQAASGAAPAAAPLATEWVLATSGTSGAPKLVLHTLDGLVGGINTAATPEPGTVWSTFYDIRRYGGLQVFLRAMLGPASLLLSEAGEPVSDYLRRVATAPVTHLLGTPSHWRMALMSSAIGALSPRYVRLSGEIADQAILDALRAAFPRARIAHAYASTEGGVGFTVEDGREGFPAGLIGSRAGIEIAIRGGTLHIRSQRTARRYLGSEAGPLMDPDGFVDSGDRVALRGDRCHFLGRSSGMINVGGVKVQPEEVETVIARHPSVSMARVKPRPNPILGAVVEAEILLHDGQEAVADPAALKAAIIAHCRAHLDRHKVPVSLSFVTDLPLTPGGKLLRTGS